MRDKDLHAWADRRLAQVTRGPTLACCAHCLAVILPGDDAEVCVRCGGASRRAYPDHCCPYCGAQVGYLGRLLAWAFGTRIHGCRQRRDLAVSQIKSPTGD